MTASTKPVLFGYAFSVYTWIAKLVLHEKDIAFDYREFDPFARPVDEDYLRLNPFCRVPTLVCDGFALYETNAIVRYLDDAFGGPSLQPVDPRERARMNQAIAIIDNYGYWPLVRQVFSHGYWAAHCGEPADPRELEHGLRDVPRVLDALTGIAGEGPCLAGASLSLGDLYVLPMIAYFRLCPRGADLLAGYPRLESWHALLSSRKSSLATRPAIGQGDRRG